MFLIIQFKRLFLIYVTTFFNCIGYMALNEMEKMRIETVVV